MSEVTKILSHLISQHSVTPDDASCQEFMGQYLSQIGFQLMPLPNSPVDNLFARIGSKSPLFVFAGHTDVVAPGCLKQWNTPPFTPTISGELLFGRGAADMKGALAAMLVATKQFLKHQTDFQGSLGFLITSAEEGDLFHLGTPYVMEQLKEKDIAIDYCIVGEPTSTTQVGDMIKIGRRGSLTADVTVLGTQGHVAYPHLAENPIHKSAAAIKELCLHKWDEGNEYFPPTTMQISNIKSGTGAGNVIPGELSFKFNFRFSPEQTVEKLQQQVSRIFADNGLADSASISWRVNGLPFITSQGKLLDATVESIKHITKLSPELSTTGGTSDARFIAPYGVEVLELGPVNETIHKANECVNLEELNALVEIYKRVLTTLLVPTC